MVSATTAEVVIGPVQHALDDEDNDCWTFRLIDPDSQVLEFPLYTSRRTADGMRIVATSGWRQRCTVRVVEDSRQFDDALEIASRKRLTR